MNLMEKRSTLQRSMRLTLAGCSKFWTEMLVLGFVRKEMKNINTAENGTSRIKHAVLYFLCLAGTIITVRYCMFQSHMTAG